jgi:hypothetical protein
MMLAGIGIDHYEVPDSDDEHDTEIVFKMGRPLGELGTGGGGREVDRFIVLSGSVKFIEEFQKQYVRISCEGDIPFTVAGNLKSWTNYNEVKPYLDVMYQKVIAKFANELFVINVGGYIGESTKKEIECALKNNVPVKYLEV